MSGTRRRALVLLSLGAAIAMAVAMAFALRFDFSLPAGEMRRLQLAILIAIPVKLAVFIFMRIDRGWWTSVSAKDAIRLTAANVIASTIMVGPIFYNTGRAFPRSIYIIDFLLCIAIISALRLGLRIFKERSHRRCASEGESKLVLIYGAGNAGLRLLREIQANPSLNRSVAGFIDDDPRKTGEVVDGVSVLGTGAQLAAVVAKLGSKGIEAGEILIAMPSASGRQMREAIAASRALKLPCRTLPSIGDLLTSKRFDAQIRDVVVEDLLGREPVELNETGIRGGIQNNVVMVTGAGGSIGSELSRQIAAFHPRKLILLDRSESDLFRIDHDLRAKFPKSEFEIVPEICDLIDARRVEEAVATHNVDSIFHAAAYKHVPLMETHPVEAARNNIVGTWNLANSAHRNKVKRFVMISSDKAVNPTNIMGATKRVTELIASCFPQTSATGDHTRFSSVRFGNVLASNGSVVPIFQKQIANGGPVTVTHPEVRRYFMTVREAVQLVLQASTMGAGSEVYVLDMGEPVRIVDLARNMIRLAGHVPDQDILIDFTGLRPGEKLFEELITSGESTRPTHHPKIKIFCGPQPPMRTILEWVNTLNGILEDRDAEALIRHLAALVPEYQAGAHWRHALQPNRAEPERRTVSNRLARAAG